MSASKHYNTLLSTIDLFTSMEVRNKGTGYLFLITMTSSVGAVHGKLVIILPTSGGSY